MSGLLYNYNLAVGLHIAAVIAWMAGLLYLPRLFVYHTGATSGSEMDLTFQTMERRLFRGIMNPAMIAVYILGAWLIWIDHESRGWRFLLEPWMLTKISGILFQTWWHHFLGRARKAFVKGENKRSEKFWRMTNELPFVAAICMVLAVTLKFGQGHPL